MCTFVKHSALWIVACSEEIQPALYLDVDCSQIMKIMIARFLFLLHLFMVCHYLLCVPYFRPVKNFSCQRRMLFRVGCALLIYILIHIRIVVIEPVSMYFATICAFSESVNAILRIFFKTRYVDRTIFRTKEI